jgi:hypothetical protein
VVKRDLRLTRRVGDDLAHFIYSESKVLVHSGYSFRGPRSGVHNLCCGLERSNFTENVTLQSSFHVQFGSGIGFEQDMPCLMIRPSWLVVKIQIRLFWSSPHFIMIPTSRSARRQLLQTVSTSARTTTNIATKAMGRTAGVATTRMASTSSRPSAIARNMLENDYRASSSLTKLGRTFATGELNAT